MKHMISLLIVSILLLSGCATSIAAGPGDEERGRLSTHMVNLSSALEVYFDGLASAPEEDDAVTLQKAIEHDSRLLAQEFRAYQLRTQYQSPYAVILLCSMNGQFAIMEDAGCSARVDRQVTHDAPCQFTLRVSDGCVVEGADQPGIPTEENK